MVARFGVKLNNNNNFSRKNIFEITTLVKNTFVYPAIAYLKTICNEIENKELKSNLLNFLEIYSDPFKFTNSDFKLNSWLKQNEYLDNILEFSINESIAPVIQKGDLHYDENLTKGVLLPLKFQFKKYFQKLSILKSMLDKMCKINGGPSDVYLNYINGKSWKQKIYKYGNDICIPYHIYFDDFEINNPLGTHCQPICGIYYSFPLSDHCSETNNIFSAGFIKTSDMKEFGNNASLKKLVQEIIEIENDGISINCKESGETIIVRFILGLVMRVNKTKRLMKNKKLYHIR